METKKTGGFEICEVYFSCVGYSAYIIFTEIGPAI